MIRVIDGDVTHEIRGRMASIIRWLVRNSEKIGKGSGRIRFSFAGQDLKATIEIDEVIE